jgi:uncharacterized protein YPO0396
MILTSWKAIAFHLTCSVRSAQRWEGMGLPVHRPFAGRRSYVIADSEKLNAWLLNRDRLHKDNLASLIQRTRELLNESRDTMAALFEQTESLKNQRALLHERTEQIRISRTLAHSRLSCR